MASTTTMSDDNERDEVAKRDEVTERDKDKDHDDANVNDANVPDADPTCKYFYPLPSSSCFMISPRASREHSCLA